MLDLLLLQRSRLAQLAAFKVVSTAVAVGTSKLLGFLNGVTLFITVLSTLATFGSIILDAFGFLDPLLARIDKLIRQVRVLLNITKEDKAQTQTAEVVANLIPESLATPDTSQMSGLGRLSRKFCCDF